MNNSQYVGFGTRYYAAFIDTVICLFIILGITNKSEEIA